MSFDRLNLFLFGVQSVYSLKHIFKVIVGVFLEVQFFIVFFLKFNFLLCFYNFYCVSC